MTKNKEKALDSFIQHKANIDALLARLQSASAEHFNTDPENINWGDVGTLDGIEEQLQRLSDMVFKEGEYAQD